MAMRVSLGQAARPSDEFLTFAQQLGMEGVQFNIPELPGSRQWEEVDLVRLRERVEQYGLRLEALEGLPMAFYEGAMLGDSRRDEEIEHIIATVRNMGRAGIPILAFGWVPTSVWRTDVLPEGRGGAMISRFDASLTQDPSHVFVSRRDDRDEEVPHAWTQGAIYGLDGAKRTDDQMWEAFEYFVGAVAPAAAEAGVQISLHPDDPPMPSLDGVARIFRNVDALVRAADFWPGAGFGFALCLGTVSEMGGEPAVLDAVRRLGARGKIDYVHLRDVKGTVPKFDECFLGEGNYDPAAVVRALGEVGFDGFILDDHTPGIVGDSPYGHRARAWSTGHIKGLIDMMQYDASSTGVGG